MKLKTITLAVITCLALAGCKDDKNDKNDTEGFDSLSSVKSKKSNGTEPKLDIPAIPKEPTKLSPTPPKTFISYKSNKSISRQMAISELAKGNYYASIENEVEGNISHYYRDNIGVAIGCGFNTSFQSHRDIRAWSKQAGISDDIIKVMESTSGKFDIAPPTGVSITPGQATAIAEAMKPTYEKAMISMFGGPTVWNKLKSYQQAVLTYHAEKVGVGGASKFKGLIQSVKNYAANPTEANARDVAMHIHYTYKVKQLDGSWKVMSDSRSQLYMGALFQDPQQYSYLLGTASAPSGFAQFAQTVAHMKIDTTSTIAASDQVEAQDELEKTKEAVAAKGIDPVAQPVVDGKPFTYTTELPVEKAPAPPKPAVRPVPRVIVATPTNTTPTITPAKAATPKGCHEKSMVVSGETVKYNECTF